ncbi:gamma-aminobutyric acid type B receptor subunit 2-like [Saccostrea echinata]|uniref:gamma-aminobutyric acid type B receptor subunit 2-like n=1 Tax=Saccostrea echinata TaxID=191078 RepID=UPI002A82F248|nr:gamma-aminobutyric acid type B receptor subunit 2-like [Saccostrea echinata]
MAIRTVGAESFVVSCVATTLGIVVTVAFLTFNVFHRNKRFIKMSSPRLNVLISVGGLCLNFVCLMFGMDFFLAERYPEATVTCQIRLWLVTIGVSLVFGPMFAKSWRVFQIFRNAGVKRVVIKDSRLFLMSSMFIAVDVVILTIWQSLDTMTSREIKYLMITNSEDIHNGTPGSEYVLIQECSSNGTSGWLAFLLLWKTGLLGYGLFLAWQTRNVTLPAMRDSPSIIISIFCTLLLSAPTFMLTSLLRHSPDGIYITEILMITICTVVVQITVFLPKVRYWWKSPIEKQSKLSVTMYDFKQKASISTDDLDIFQLQSENDVLKVNVKEKMVQIRDLERKVSHLTGRISALLDDDDRRDSGLDVDLGISEVKDETVTMDTYLATNPSSRKSMENLTPSDTSAPNNTSTPHDESFDRTQSDTSNMKSYKAKKYKRKHKKILTSTPDIYKQSEKSDTKCRSDDFFDMEHSNARFRSRCWTFSSMRSRQDIVGSVTKCYDLEDNDDTFSYVSNYLPPPPPSEQIEFSLRNNSLCAVTDNTVLSNDMLYPVSNCDSSNLSSKKESEINGNSIKHVNGNCITPGKTCYV